MSRKVKVYRRIRDLREDHDLTQAQAAQKIGLQLTTYRRYETGESPLPAPVLEKLAKLYGVRTDYILGLTDKQK